MADIESLMATIERPMVNIESRMAIIKPPMANIEALMATITSRYGENYSGMAKTPWRTVSSGRSFHFSGTAAFLAKRLASLRLRSRASRRRSSSAKRANREAESAERCSSVVSQRFNDRLDELEELSGFLLFDLAIDRRGYRLSAGQIVAAQEHQKQFRSQIGAHNVAGATGAPRFRRCSTIWSPARRLFSKHRTADFSKTIET